MGFFRSCSPPRGRVSAAQGKEWEGWPTYGTLAASQHYLRSVPQVAGQPHQKLHQGTRIACGPTLAAPLPALQSSCNWWRKGPCRAGFFVVQFCPFPAAH